MNEIIKPDYIHYSRLDSITAEEAKWLLASIELRERGISDPDEYNSLLEEGMKFASRVLIAAIARSDGSKLAFIPNGFYRDVNDSGITMGYCFKAINFKVSDFCSWASEKYNLPEELAKLTKDFAVQEPVKNQQAEGDNGKTSSNAQGNANKGGKPKGFLTEAVEHVYYKLLEQGKTGLFKPSKIREFMITMKEMASKKGPRADEYVLERIKSINIPEEGRCTIITEDQIILKGLNENILRGRPYSNNDVAKRLTQLRKNNPFSL